MRPGFGQLNEVVPVARHQQEITFVGELEHYRIGRLFGEHVPHQHNLMSELLEEIALLIRHIVIEQECHACSCAVWRATNRSISLMVFVLGEALIHLRLGQRRDAARDHTVDGFAILEEPDHLVHADASAFHPRVPAPDIR